MSVFTSARGQTFLPKEGNVWNQQFSGLKVQYPRYVVYSVLFVMLCVSFSLDWITAIWFALKYLYL